MSVALLPADREPLSQYPRAGRLSAEQIAGLLWILRYVGDGMPDAFELEVALEALDIERGAAA